MQRPWPSVEAGRFHLQHDLFQDNDGSRAHGGNQRQAMEKKRKNIYVSTTIACGLHFQAPAEQRKRRAPSVFDLNNFFPLRHGLCLLPNGQTGVCARIPNKFQKL